MHLFPEKMVHLYTTDGPLCFKLTSLGEISTALNVLVLYFSTVYYWVEGTGEKLYVAGLETVHKPYYCVGAEKNSQEILRDTEVKYEARRMVLETEDKTRWVKSPCGVVFSLEDESEVVPDAYQLLRSRR